MPFKPGHSGNPAGRPKGAKNKRTHEIEAILEYYGYDPIESLILFATNAREKLGLDQDVSPELRFQAAKEICQYTQPKLRSTDLNVAVRDDPVKNLMDEIAGNSRYIPGKNRTFLVSGSNGEQRGCSGNDPVHVPNDVRL